MEMADNPHADASVKAINETPTTPLTVANARRTKNGGL